MAADRMRQINELLRSEIALHLQREVDLPDGAVVSVTKVSTSPDLRNATILVSIVPHNLTGSILNSLRREIRNASKTLSSKLSLRTFPRLKISLDEQERAATHIEALLDSIKE